MRTVRLFLHLLVMDLNARSQYRVDFLIGMTAAVMQHPVTLAMLWLVFQQVSALGGWTAPQAVVLYALFALVMGLTNLIGMGLRELPGWIEYGEFDWVLVQPVSPFVMLLPRFSPGPLGDIALALALLGLSAGPAGIEWTPLGIAFTGFAVVCGVVVMLGILTMVYSIAFWVRESGVTRGVEELTQLARYPAGIYPRWIQALITWVFPVAFASYYPAAVLTGAEQVAP